MAKVSIEIIGLEKIKLRKFAMSMGNMHQPYTRAMQYLRTYIKRDAGLGRKLGGGRMESYSKSYKGWLAKHGRTNKPYLRLSGQMMDDMSVRVGRTRAQIGYWNRNKSQMLANVHHKGRRDGTIPARPWFGWRKRYVDHIERRILWPWIQKEAGKAGVEFTAQF